MLSVKQTAKQYAINLKGISAMFEALKMEWAKFFLEMRTGGMDTRMWREQTGMGRSYAENMLEFFNRTQTQISSIEDRLAVLKKSCMRFNKSLGRVVDNHLDDMKKAMMLPFSTMLEGFHMLSRDISHEQGKDVDLVIHGQEIEIDRRIMEDMKDPLIHLVRNSIDHGIERPEKRVMNKKPGRGTIKIAISHIAGNKIELVISDDGAGIDIERLKHTAVKDGIISQPEADTLDIDKAVSLIFKSGISTSPIITEISGRGLGLAIVQEKIERLNGSISVETSPNAGTTFTIVLPLTVATFRGVVVKVSGQKFIIPTTSVERGVRVRSQEIKTVENRETIPVNGMPVSFVRLNSVLEMPSKKTKGQESSFTTALVLNVGGKRIAFGADEIVDEQEVFAKDLGKQLSRVRNVAGAAILGSGSAVPILNVSDMARSAVKKLSAYAAPAALFEKAEKKSILIVEDSITSRILLRNILESAGYTVKTAVDGIDAVTMLKTEAFDLVVSDIEMPRMNGFELTAKIRSDKKLAEIPVVLVTALEASKDRERGIDVGANAYIVKSSFDQSNLLEVVKRLV